MRFRWSLYLNIISLALGLFGAAFAGWPSLRPFHGQELMDLTIDATYPHKTAAYESWESRNDELGRLGLVLVAAGTVAGAIAQMVERKQKA